MPDDNKINISAAGGFKLPEEYYVAAQDNTKIVINFKMPVKHDKLSFGKAMQKALNIKTGTTKRKPDFK